MHKSTVPASACLLATAISTGCGALGGPEFTFKPEEATLSDVRSLVKAGVVSCKEMVSRYQLMHESIDPKLRAIVSWNSRVMADADRLDQTLKAQRGSFHCVPILVKDNMNVSGMETTGGAQALGGAITGNNAAVVDRLLAAGAIVLGKANMPDFATDGINTLSSFGGQTVNPYNHALTVYGSSGGNGAGISASLGIIGLGSDTYGSLLHPASATGLVAIRPTHGLVPGSGILPLMSLQDMAGPMTRTVEDAAATLELLVDKQLANLGSQNYTGVLNRDGLKGLTIGFDQTALQTLPMPPLNPSPEVVDLFNRTLGNLQQAGATTKQVEVLLPLFPVFQAAVDSSMKCMPVDFKESLNKYLTTLRPEAPVRSLTDIRASGKFLPSVKSFLDSADMQTDSISSNPDCQQFLTARMNANAAITSFMDMHGLDLLVYPASNQPAFRIGMPPAGWYGFQALSSNTGLPSLTMPMGIAPKDGAPVGFVLLARNYQEAKLVQAAYAYQDRFHPRTTPPNAAQ